MLKTPEISKKQAILFMASNTKTRTSRLETDMLCLTFSMLRWEGGVKLEVTELRGEHATVVTWEVSARPPFVIS